MFSNGAPTKLYAFRQPSYATIAAFVHATPKGRQNGERTITGRYVAVCKFGTAAIRMHGTDIWTVWEDPARPPLVDTGGWGHSPTTRSTIEVVCGVRLYGVAESCPVKHGLWARTRYGMCPVLDSFHLQDGQVPYEVPTVLVLQRNVENRKAALDFKRRVRKATKPLFIMLSGHLGGQPTKTLGREWFQTILDAANHDEEAEAARAAAMEYIERYGANAHHARSSTEPAFAAWLMGEKNNHLYSAFEVWEDVAVPYAEAALLLDRRV